MKQRKHIEIQNINIGDIWEAQDNIICEPVIIKIVSIWEGYVRANVLIGNVKYIYISDRIFSHRELQRKL